jgi:16S rRNA (guanine1516-N2)-methyltransferase
MVDFSKIDIRTGSGGLSKKQPLVKAFGQRVRTIIDATAGLGHDAFLLACCGFEVTAIERNLVVFSLLRDGLRRAQLDPRLRAASCDRLRITRGDARELLRQSVAPSHQATFAGACSPTLTEPPDAIFIDPMFPPKRKKSALAKKSIRLVRQLVGDDADAGELLEIALQAARNRVVVKRADDAPPLRDKPSLSFGGKLTRYDVYLVGR